MLLALSVVLLGVVLWWGWQRGSRFNRMMSKFPGPRAYPFVGNALQVGTNSVAITNFFVRMCKEYHRTPFATWIGTTPNIFLTNPKDLEIILGSNTQLEKGEMYECTKPLLGSGLITSSAPIWRKHRKILNPAFNLNQLQSFVDIFKYNGEILVEKLKQKIGGPGFDIRYLVDLYALDVIYESAMGVKINAQLDSKSEFVKAMDILTEYTMMQMMKPWYRNEFIFTVTGLKKIYNHSLKICTTLSAKIIKTRNEKMTKERALRDVTKSEEDVDQSDGVTKHSVLLDTLIESTFNGSGLTEEDIREEADTFLAAGAGTTAGTISFALWVLSWHQEIQDKVFQELEEVFPDPGEPVTFHGLQELKYMERVIKETLRLYPSAAAIARQLTEDVQLSGGLIAPKNITVIIPIFAIHRDPETFPDPLKFDPDRFLPENSLGRHPYAYIPFSAGPRNCIGQKYAMLEMKHALALILRAYKVLPGTEEPNLVLAVEIALVSKTGIHIKIVPRSN